tara:strand:+ start:242 stop:547 length:306 start_codon:yes stop_codon:yes gene_type:complete
MKYLNLFLVSLVLTGCAATPHMPAFLFSSTKGNVTSTLARGAVKKTGSSCTKNFLGLVSVGDASIESARKDAGIKKIAYIDNSYKNILGLYQEYCTLVRGK